MDRQRIGSLPVKVVGALSDVALHGYSHRGEATAPDTSFVSYDPVGDFAEFMLKPVPYFSQYIDENLTVYVSRDTKRPIGGQLCGFRALVERILKNSPGFKVAIQHNSVSVCAIFQASRWAKDRSLESVNVDVYEEIVAVASKVEKKLALPEPVAT